MQILISSNFDNLNAARVDVAVEAEYGEMAVDGRLLSMNHHGPRAGNTCPCLYENIGMGEDTVIGISHVDLDTIGGIMAVMGVKPEAEAFWKLAAFIDLNGPHKLSASGASDKDIRALRAYWAFSEESKVYSNRNGAVEDVTREVDRHVVALKEILSGDAKRLKAGAAWLLESESLDADSFLFEKAGVFMRSSDRFVNHLYVNASVGVAKAIVGWNTEQASVTLSFAEDGTGDACKIVQGLWGPLAGGHKGIAGSPRGQAMTLEDAKNCHWAVVKVLSSGSCAGCDPERPCIGC